MQRELVGFSRDLLARRNNRTDTPVSEKIIPGRDSRKNSVDESVEADGEMGARVNGEVGSDVVGAAEGEIVASMITVVEENAAGSKFITDLYLAHGYVDTKKHRTSEEGDTYVGITTVEIGSAKNA